MVGNMHILRSSLVNQLALAHFTLLFSGLSTLHYITHNFALKTKSAGEWVSAPDPTGELTTLHHANLLAGSLTPEIRCCRCPYVGASPQTFDVRTATERGHKSMHYRPLQTTSFDTAHFSHLILHI